MNNLYRTTARRLLLPGLFATLFAAHQATAQVDTVQPVALPQDVVPDTAPIPASVKQRILDHMQQANLERLRGWPGLIFYCPTEDAKNANLKNICTAVNADIGRLMSASNVRFQVAKSPFDLHFLPHVTGRLLLVVELEGTPAEGQPAAIFAKVKALAHYGHAVNRSSELHPLNEPGAVKSPLEVPQHVDAMLWESNLIVSGSASQSALGENVKNGVEERIKAFLAEFTKINARN
jgi:hypothetical protein